MEFVFHCRFNLLLNQWTEVVYIVQGCVLDHVVYVDLTGFDGVRRAGVVDLYGYLLVPETVPDIVRHVVVTLHVLLHPFR